MPLPMVGSGDDKMDVMSRLLKDRIVLLGQGVDDEVGNLLVAQLLYLANEDAQRDITMYINSPGGSVTAGFGAGFGASAEKSACSLALLTSDAVASSPRNGLSQEARNNPAANNSTVSDP